MPLSEHEQRILDQIERGFYEHDPRSARRISTTTLPRYLRRRGRIAAGAFLVGLVLLVAFFATTPVVGLIGFVIMTVSAVALVQNLRRRGRLGLQSVAARLGRGGGLAARWRAGAAGRFGRRSGEGRAD